MVYLSVVLWVTVLVHESRAACPGFQCSDLTGGVCAVLASKTLVKLNNAQCPTGTACKLSGVIPYMNMLDFIPSFPQSYPCPELVPPDSTPYTPQDCGTKLAKKNWKAGGTTLLCSSNADCVMQDDLTATCMCSPRTDGKNICMPDASNTDTFGDYWALCEANGNKMPTQEAYNYYSLLLSMYALKDADMSCASIFYEVGELTRLKTIYMCSIQDASCPCTGATYLDVATVTCANCNENCATCKVAGANSCLTCPVGAKLSGTAPSNCVCVAGTFPNPNTLNCSQCDTSCASCSAGGATDCDSCKTNAQLSGGKCSCPITSGYFGGPADCLPCDPSCAMCEGPTSNDCRNPCGTSLPNGDCDSCLAGFYLDTGKCKVCDKSCKKCSGAGSSSCTECHTGALLSSGVCSCADGTYLSLSALACTACNSKCATCDGGTETSCSSCKSNATLSSGACTCNSTYYWKTSTAVCDSCSSSCATCSGSSTTCQTCKSGATLNGSVCSCVSGSPDASNCVLCSSSCTGCTYTAPNVCTSCSASLFLVNGVCRGCPDTCTTCSGSDCSGCYSNAVVTSATPKRCACGNGFYPNPTVVSCSACNSSCMTCSGPGSTSCLSCYSPAQLSGTSCVCPSGTYPNPGANLCASCDVTCSTCTTEGTSSCTACKSGASLSSGTCQCNDGSFPNPNASLCTACDLSCKTCSGAGTDKCLTCDANAQLAGGVSPGTCECAAGLTGTPASGCLVCHATCQTCSDAQAGSCKSCKLGGVLVGTVPSACTCASGYLPVPDASNCSPCDITCSPGSGLPPCLQNCGVCSGGVCQKCINNSSLSGTVCVTTCPSGYFASQGVCTECSAPCVSCSSASTCLSCDVDHVIRDGSCVRDCPAKYFSIDNSDCMPCDETCGTCDGPLSTSCLTCGDGYYRVDDLCFPCADCATCNSLGTCTSCVTGFNLTLTGSCESCSDCDQPITVTLGNPKPNVFSVSFSRGINHFFLAIDFVISTVPPATGLVWTVENNPTDTLRRRLNSGVSLVYLNIISGTWDSTAIFTVAFSNSSTFADVYGESLPTSLSFTSTAPLGPEIADSEGDDDGPSDGTIIGAVIGSVLGLACLILVALLIRRWRKSRKPSHAKKYEEVAVEQSSMQMSR